jgi:ankyrin repeat protein
MTLHKEELNLSRICLGYLSFRYFNTDAGESKVEKWILDRYYIFAEYAIVYWPEHLLAGINGDFLDETEVELLKKSIARFLNLHFIDRDKVEIAPQLIPAGLEMFKESVFFDDLVQAIIVHKIRKSSDKELLKKVKDAENLMNNLALEDILRHVRSNISLMSRSTSTKSKLERIYGPQLFRCYNIQCRFFDEGFREATELSAHEEKHWRLSCPVAGCLATFCGKNNHKDLKNHIDRIHKANDGSTFVDRDRPGFEATVMTEAVQDFDKKAVLDTLRADAERNGDVVPKPCFYHNLSYRGVQQSEAVWKEAIRNPNKEMLKFLTEITTFTGTTAQRFILEHAIGAKNYDLVHQFGADKYHRGVGYRLARGWKRPVKAAMKLGDAEILEIAVESAMRSTKLGKRSKTETKVLRKFCLEAAVAQNFPCVRYFVSMQSVDPFEYHNHSIIQNNWILKSKDAASHSVLYHAVELGQDKLVKYLGDLRGRRNFRAPEPMNLLIKLAAANGHAKTVEILGNWDDASQSLAESALYSASLYAAIRDGKNGKALSLLQTCDPYDIPDQHHCTPIMYAAYNGLYEVVKHLVRKGAKIYNEGKFPLLTPPKYCLAASLAYQNGHMEIFKLLEVHDRI